MGDHTQHGDGRKENTSPGNWGGKWEVKIKGNEGEARYLKISFQPAQAHGRAPGNHKKGKGRLPGCQGTKMNKAPAMKETGKGEGAHPTIPLV